MIFYHQRLLRQFLCLADIYFSCKNWTFCDFTVWPGSGFAWIRIGWLPGSRSVSRSGSAMKPMRIHNKSSYSTKTSLQGQFLQYLQFLQLLRLRQLINGNPSWPWWGESTWTSGRCALWPAPFASSATPSSCSPAHRQHQVKNQCCGFRIRIFTIPDPNFSTPDPRSTSKNLSIFLTPKLVSKLSEIWAGLFIPDPVPYFYRSWIQGSKRHRIPDPDPQHCKKSFFSSRLVFHKMCHNKVSDLNSTESVDPHEGPRWRNLLPKKKFNTFWISKVSLWRTKTPLPGPGRPLGAWNMAKDMRIIFIWG